MKKILILLLLPALFGPAGYFGSQYLMPTPAPEAKMMKPEAAPQARLFKMPLGKVTIQVIRARRVLHVLIDLDVYLEGAAAFERMNGAEGRTRLRDATIEAVSDISETALWYVDGGEVRVSNEELAERIAFKLNRKFEEVRHVEILTLTLSESLRN